MKMPMLFALAVMALAAPALADGELVPPITHEATLKECSACHMAFAPQMLPARSWTALMGGLADHFGENAELDAATAADISAFLVANAADAGGNTKSPWLRRLKESETPLRITETPWWIRAHRDEVSPSAYNDPKVGSKANCIACHRAANKGYYEDD